MTVVVDGSSTRCVFLGRAGGDKCPWGCVGSSRRRGSLGGGMLANFECLYCLCHRIINMSMWLLCWLLVVGFDNRTGSGGTSRGISCAFY